MILQIPSFHGLRLFIAGAAFLLLISPACLSASSDEASAFYEKSREYFYAEKYDEAIVEAKNALQRETTFLPARILLGKAYLKAGDPLSAEQELMLAIGMNADHALIDEPLADALIASRKYDALIRFVDPLKHNGETAFSLYIKLGDAYLELVNWAKAEDMYASAARVYPERPEPLVGKAMILLNQGDIASASQLADSALALDAESAEVWYVRGRIAQAEADFAKALEYFSRVLESNKKHHMARMSKVSLLVDAAHYQEALTELERASEQVSFDPLVSYLEALIYKGLGQEEKSTMALDKAVRIIDGYGEEALFEHGPSLYLAGAVALLQDNPEKAVFYLEKYVARYPGQVGARKRLAEAYLALKNPNAALLVLDPLDGRYQTDSATLVLLGRANLGAGSYLGATAYFEKAAEFGADSPAQRLGLAQSYLATDRIDSAIEVLNIAFETPATRKRAGLTLAMLYLKQGQHAQARSVAEQLLLEQPDNPVFLNILAASMMEVGEYAAAREVLEKIRGKAPGDSAVLLNLARLDALEGRPDKARAVYASFLKKDPQDFKALVASAKLEESLRQWDAAIELRRKIYSVYPDALDEAVRLVNVYLQAKRPAEALALAQGLQSNHPEKFSVLSVLGLSEVAAGKADMARVTFRNMSARAGYEVKKLRVISGLQFKAGDVRGAHWTLIKAVEAEPDNIAAIAELAALEIRLEQLDKAQKHAEQVQLNWPDRAMGFMLQGDIAIHRKDYGAAESWYQRGFAIESNADLVIRLHRARYLQGDVRHALRGLTDWLEQHPEADAVRQVLTDSLTSQGQMDDALH